MLNPTMLCDFYKVGHINQYPKGTEKIYSTWTCRGSRLPGVNHTVFFGLQGFIQEYLVDYFNQNFFDRSLLTILEENKRAIEGGLGIMNPDLSHIKELHDLGWLPLEIMALPEGTNIPIRCPSFTVTNTLNDFFWLVNGLETLISTEMWSSITTATIAKEYRKILDGFALETTGSTEGVDFQAHDFSMRGMNGVSHAAKAGCGHLLSFLGTDCIPSMFYLEEYYDGNMDNAGIGCSIPATEHSVQCANMPEDEDETSTIERMITEVYPTGLVSMVLDTNDFWKNVTEVLPRLKDTIMQRDGKLVVRPDCYDNQTSVLTQDGWKLFKDLSSDDYVAQVMDDETFEFVKPQEYIEQDYKGEMICFKDKKGKLDLRVTPNHRMLYKKAGKWIVQEAEKCTKTGYHTKDILRSATAINSNHKLSPLNRLKVAFQADGSYCTTTDGKRGIYKHCDNKIRFSFSKQRKIDRLIDIIMDGGYKFVAYDLKDGKTEIHIDLPSSYFKKDFSWVNTFDMCSNWCKDFIEEISYWDGSRRSDQRFKFDTTIKSVIDVVELVAMGAGYGVLISEVEDNRKDIFSDIFTAHILKNNHLGGQSIKKSIEFYSGKVYCVKVPTGRLIVKRNRGTAVCGNSGDPADIICGTLNSIKDYSDGCKDMDCLKEWVKEDLMEEFIWNISLEPGECGPDSVGTRIKWENKYYDITLGDIEWNRHDKTYYYHDQYSEYKWEIEEVGVTPEHKGLIEILWDTFGGTINEQGYKVLDPHIGAIYGDSITLERAKDICQKLKDKGFASTNIVLGVGSYSYAYHTRDTFGMAFKSTYAVINGEEVFLSKNPKTDDGLKKSQKGMVAVGSDLVFKDELTQRDLDKFKNNAMVPVFRNGYVLKFQTLDKIRELVKE